MGLLPSQQRLLELSTRLKSKMEIAVKAKTQTEDTIRIIIERAEAFERKHVQPGYYLEHDDNRDAGEEWCRKCVGRVRLEMQKEATDGKWHILRCDDTAAHDGLYRCARCGRHLHGWLTRYGAIDELSYFESDGFNRRKGEDCYVWYLCNESFCKGSSERIRLLAVAGIDSQG